MGSMNAMGMAEAVDDGMVSLRSAIHYHLTVNHYPPVGFMLDTAMEAIESAPYDLVGLPEGVEFRDGRTEVEAWRIIESLHLEAFVFDPEADDA